MPRENSQTQDVAHEFCREIRLLRKASLEVRACFIELSELPVTRNVFEASLSQLLHGMLARHRQGSLIVTIAILIVMHGGLIPTPCGDLVERITFLRQSNSIVPLSGKGIRHPELREDLGVVRREL